MKNKWNPEVIDASGPKYLALVEALEAGIASGKLNPGDRLPSHREFGKLFGVTIATVTKAMAEATRRGIIEARVGSGTFIREREAVSRESKPIDLCINTLPTAVVAGLLGDALSRIAPGRLCDDLFNYSPYAGLAQHRKLGAAWIARLGTPVSPDNLLLTNGVHQGLLAAFGALLAPGQTAVCEPLTYTGIKRIADFRGVQLAGAESDEEGLLPDSVERELRRTGARVLVVTTVMQNPTTATLGTERRLALAEICRRNDAWIVEDGVNIPLANDGTPSLAALAPERTIHLTGFSKCIASGFRLGYAAVPEARLGAFHEALVGTQWIGPGFYAELASGMLADGLIEQCIARHREEALARVAMASGILARVHPTRLPSYHAWVDTPAGWSAEDFAAHALQLGVRISPASHFALSPGSLPAAYRISLGTCATRAELEQALLRLAGIGNGRSLSYDTVI